MKTCYLLLALVFVPLATHAQKFNNFTRIEVEYSHAFQGTIFLEAKRVTPDKVELFSQEFRPSDGNEKSNGKDRVTATTSMEAKDLAPLLAFFNAQENRDYFATVIFDNHHLDGSSLSITIRQQGFSVTFATLVPFSEKSDSTVKEFSELARALLKKSGLVLSGKELQ